MSEGRSLCSEVQKRLTVFEIYSSVFHSEVASHAVQAPDTPPESVDVFTVCLDQVGLGLGAIDSLQGIH